jgi:preprotein translocase subunit SecD
LDRHHDDGADVKSARVRPSGDVPSDREGWLVAVELGPAGAERFRAFTASHVKRRLAIVVDGVVESAPVILSEIGGGHLQITMEAGSAEQQLVEAKRLEARLLGRP